jgi:serine/threonine protein phosphatase PrpC
MLSRRLFLLVAAVTLPLQFSMQRSTSFFGRLIPSALPRQLPRFAPLDLARVHGKAFGIQLEHPLSAQSRSHPVLSATLPSTQAGFATKAGFLQNTAKVNQDSCAATEDLVLVCDGHGRSGEVISQMVTEVLPQLIAGGDPTAANLRSAFLAMDAQLEALGHHSERAGSTAVAVVLTPRKLVCAYLGDSHAILGRRSAKSGLWDPIPLSGSHKPDMPDEAERIIAAGGRVTRSAFGPARVNGLAMSRAFGDFDAKSAGVIAEPDVNEHVLRPTDEVLIVGSDGVWDVLDESEVLALLEPYWTSRNAEGGAKAVVDAARAVWKGSPSGYGDDITCVVTWLH